MGAAAIELRNCVVRKPYTVSYAAMTVYDGMTLSSFPVVEPMVVGVWQSKFIAIANPIRAARLYTEKPHDALVLVRSATRREPATAEPGQAPAGLRPRAGRARRRGCRDFFFETVLTF